MQPTNFHILLALAVSALAGLGFGWLGGGGEVGQKSDALSDRAAEISESAKPGARALNALEKYARGVYETDDLRAQTALFLTSLATADVAELQSLLRYGVGNPALPKALQGFYQQAVVDRLIELGEPMAALSVPGLRGDRQDALLRLTIKTLAETNPTGAEALVGSLGGREQAMAIEALLPVLGEKDPARGLALIQSNSEARDQTDSFFESWAKIDPEKAVMAERELGRSNPRYDSTGALSEWAKVNPDAAWEFITQLPPSEIREAQNAYLRAFMDDPARAIAEVQKRGFSTESYVLEQIGGKFAKNLQEADAAIADLSPGELRKSVIDGVAARLAQQDADQALSWVDTLPVEDQKSAVSKIIQNLGYSDPETTLRLINE